MTLDSFREMEGWSLERLAEELGLKSKGYLSDLQSGRQPWPVELALRAQLVSKGRVRAIELVPEEKRELIEQLQADEASPA